MSKDKKNSLEQIKFVDKLLPMYGIDNLKDNKNIINVNMITSDDINHINTLIPEFRKIFPTKQFNLGRTKYIINSKSLAFSFLK